jgi:RHS repeat-associated protein
VPLNSAAKSANGSKNISKPSVPINSNLQSSGRREGELLIRFRSGVSEYSKSTVLVSQGARRKKQLRGESTIEKLEVLGGQNIDTVALQLSLNPDVEFVEPNFVVRKDDLGTSDPKFSEQWALRNTGAAGGQFGSDINVTEAWQTTTGLSSVVIAIVDSGIDFTHPDLANNRWENPTPSAEADVNGWDYITDSGSIRDEQGHGTAIAGIVAAEGNNAIGIAGVMWHASLMSLRVLDSTGTGDVASAVEAIDYAATHGAQVINLSWGTTGASLALKDAIERAMRRGVVVVCSAGNNGQDVDSVPYYPASFGSRDLIAVASSDNFDQLTSWSDYGRRNITVAAPGSNILTTQMGGSYANVSGTSASAPLVSGVAGLLKSISPALGTHNIVKAITDSARPVSSLSDKVSSGGVIDASAALRSVRGNPYRGNGNGNGNGNGQNGNGQGQGQGQGNGQSNAPPALRPDNSERRANGKDGSHVPAPPGLSGAPLANLPNLDQSRKVRTSPITSAPPATIHANLMCADCDPSGGGGAGGSDPYFATARTRPENEVGDPGVTLGSRNFNWGLPIVQLPGRSGLDLSIALYYNSLVWTKQGNSIQYNADHGTPAPGFQIGLPRLQAQYLDSDDGTYAYTMITPSGGRVELKLVSSGVYESSDGTYSQLTFSGSTPIVKATDGTQYVFGVALSGEYRCTQIKDRNGNYISATYNTSNGHLLTITDTLGRVISFNYDNDSNLSTIQQTWGNTTHTWATFIYGPAYMSYSFPGLYTYGATNNSNQTVLAYVAFPDNTSYHFDYNSYGQVYQIHHAAPDGHELEHTIYTINASGSQTDCPRFTDKREWAQDWINGQEAITSYSVTSNATWTKPETSAQQTGTLVQLTAPDGTIYKEYSHATGWDAGLTQLTETWSASARKKYVSTTWTQDNTSLSYPQNPRVTEVSIYDDAGNRRRTTIEYVSGYNLPTHVREYANDGVTLLRLTVTGYKWDSAYFDKRIIGLPYERVVYDGASGNPVSHLIYHYDWSDNYFPTQVPSTNFTNLGYYEGRGNLVGIQRYDCSTPSSAYDGNQAVWLKLFRYNMAGSPVWIEDGSWHRTYIAYGDSFSDGNNSRNTLAYPTQVTDHDGNYSTTQYKFDFGAVTRTHVPTSGTGGNTTYVDEVRTYDAYGRLEQATNQTNSAYVRFVYDTNGNFIHTYQTILDLTTANELHSWQVLDGAGRVRAAVSDHPGSTGGYTGQAIIFDSMGRVVEQYNPTEMNGTWVLAGDDVYVSSTEGGWRSTQQAYDWKGRPTVTTNADGTQRSVSYGGCGCAGGEVTTAQDEHGRQRRFTKDTLGRLGTVEELNWSGSVYATTSYSYNARDQITQSNQAGQYRTFAYDGHGRLQSRTTPEQGTTSFSYNVDDTTNVMTDARGATTTYGYNAEHLVTSLTYGTPSPVAATPNVSYAYDAAGNRTSMTDGLGSATYNYNNLAQLTSETRAFTGVGSYTLTYSYNLAGELASVTNPWNAQVSYVYDKAGRLTTVNGSGYYSVSNYANSMAYRAFGAIKSMTYGNIQNAHSLTTAYDRRLRPTKWDVSNVLGYNYNYDYLNEHTGRVTYAGSIYDSTLDRSYEYDHVGRLAISHSGNEARAHAYSGQWSAGDGPYSHGYDYDVWGNLTHRYGWGGDGQSSGDIYRTYTNNRMDGFTYDAAGNLATNIATYDATGQQVSFPGGGMTHSFDGDGLRAMKTENGAATYYLRSSVLGGQVVAELNWFSVAWGWNRGYVYAGSQLLAVQQGGVNWIHEDPVTKSKRVTNSSGAVVSTIELDPWGASTNRNVNSAFQPRKFTSYTADADGGDDAMMRRYGTYWSRFSQPDPYDGSYSLTDPQSFNRYAYVQNDPVNFVDPTGLMPCQPGNYSAECDSSGFGGWGGGWNFNDHGHPGRDVVRKAEVDYNHRAFSNLPLDENFVGEFAKEFQFMPLWMGFLGTDLEKRQKEYDDKFRQILDEQYDCFDRAGAEKERQFRERIGATTTERLKKVYKGVLPSLDSLGKGATGSVLRTLAGRGGAVVGFVEGVGVGAVWRVWSNSAPIFADWARIDKDWIKARINCTSETSAKVAALGPRPK